jgi:hypothetical protein
MISGVVTFVAIAVPILAYITRKYKNIKPFKIKIVHKVPAVLLVFGLVALSFTGTAMKVPEKSEIWLEKSDQTSVRIEIVGDGWTISDNLVAYKEDTAFSLLEKCSVKNGFSLKATYYAEFDSTLIDSINNAASGTDGKYWQYFVNDRLPNVGADKCPISNGDSVLWSFEVLSN